MSTTDPTSGDGNLPRMEELNKLIKRLESDPGLIEALKNDAEFRRFASEYKKDIDEFVTDTIARLEMLARLKSNANPVMNTKKRK